MVPYILYVYVDGLGVYGVGGSSFVCIFCLEVHSHWHSRSTVFNSYSYEINFLQEICVATKLLNTSAGTSAATTPHYHSTYSSGTIGLSASAHSRLSASSMSPANMSPYRSYPSRTASPLMFSSRPQSPAMSLMATLRYGLPYFLIML